MKNHFRKPVGWFGRRVLRRMNRHHSPLTEWGLSQLTIPGEGAILDVGCGGGSTIAKLLAAPGSAKVFGLDHSDESVRMAAKTNSEAIHSGRVEIRQGSVSQLPYTDNTFNLVTAVETHFFWPNLAGDVREVFRVVKPGGLFAIIAEVFRDPAAETIVGRFGPELGMTILTPDEHRSLLSSAGFDEIQIVTDPAKSWISAIGRKPCC